MSTNELHETATALVAPGKGILGAQRGRHPDRARLAEPGVSERPRVPRRVSCGDPRAVPRTLPVAPGSIFSSERATLFRS